MPNLVGIGNSQVPTNAMLGGLAYQDSVSDIDIEKIKAKTNDTAVDVFVYDTSKDSDGGAWRHRTQNTSWYNEGASATRGARKEFPAVAVIVTESAKLTIYDGDDPNLPMWMVFNNTGSDIANVGILGRAQDANKAAEMLNGILFVGNANYFATYIPFISENVIDFIDSYASVTGPVRFNGNIEQRNEGLGKKAIAGNKIRPGSVNDVSMTVLPNAPIDESTGLPMPTIAVATSGGVSIIRDSGAIHDLISNNEAKPIAEIAFLADNRYSFATTANNSRWTIDDIQGHDESANYYYQRTSFDYSGSGISVNPLGRVNGTSRGEVGEAIFRQASGISRIRYEDGLLNYTTTDYNTGWMCRDIKGAFLSDTDDTDVTGTYLYLDNFSNNDKGWSFADNSGGGISGGVMTITTQTSARATDYDALNGVATGTKLLVKFTVTFGAAGTLSLDDDGAGAGVGGNTNLLQASKSGSGTQTFSSIYTKTASNRVRFIRTNGGNFQIDNFEMKILPEEDRSTNNNGLAVYGTVPKQAVATGAELVSYGPFSTSNRLQQPYNSDFDFGTGEFSVMFWFKSTASGSEQFVRKGDPSTDVGCFESYITAVGGAGNVRFVIKHTDGSSNTVLNAATQGWNNGVWHHYVGVRRSGGNMQLYLNGELSSSTTSTYNVSNNLSVLDIGSVGSVANGAASTYLSLVKISASTPSPEVIKKIYDDEKCLYHENAKCTLHGASNSVTAIAYDDTNDVLHVGTSGGRSDFRGLNRINNTTTAVTTEISASNGLVAEQ